MHLVLNSMLYIHYLINPHSKPRGQALSSPLFQKKQWLSPCQSGFPTTELRYHENQVSKNRLSTWRGQYSSPCALWVLKHKCQKAGVFPKLYLNGLPGLTVASLSQKHFRNLALVTQGCRSERKHRARMAAFPDTFCFIWCLFSGRYNEGYKPPTNKDGTRR